MDVFDLVATLKLDSSGYESGLNNAEGGMKSLGSKLSTAAKVGTVAVGAMAAGVTAAGVAFTKAAGDAAEYGDAIDKSSQKLGISAEAYQEWDAVLQHSGTSIDSMSATFKKLANASQDATADQVAAFERIGLSMEQVSSMSAEDLFGAVITGLQGMEEGTERTALATELLGRGAMELGPLLNTSAEDTQAMRDRVRELGGVMSDEAVKAAAAYQDSLQDMQTAIAGIKRNLISDFLPSVTTVMDGITGLFTGDQEGGLSKISEGIDGIISEITEKLPDIVNAGVSIVESFAQAILDNLPKIMESGTDMLIQLVQGIVSNLPTVLEAGIQSIVSLATGIGEALPTLIPAAVDAVITFAIGLLDNLPEIIEAGIELIIGLATGMIEAIPVIIERLPEIITAIIGAFERSWPKIVEAGEKLFTMLVENLPGIISGIIRVIPEILGAILTEIGKGFDYMVQAGVNLITGLGQGLIDGVGWVVDQARAAGAAVLDAVKGFFGISSPSKVFIGIGGFLMQGLANGILDGLSAVESAMDDVDEALMIDDNGNNYDEDIVTTETSANDMGNWPPLIQPENDRHEGSMTTILEIDGTEFARAVYRYNRQETQRVGLNLAGGYA